MIILPHTILLSIEQVLYQVYGFLAIASWRSHYLYFEDFVDTRIPHCMTFNRIMIRRESTREEKADEVFWR